ncbi:MAG: hydrogenase formation protein HypD [Desulfuromonadales bacterium]|nr:hydrogenase formation protein HypD [Desulfuromonadales bacterium]
MQAADILLQMVRSNDAIRAFAEHIKIEAAQLKKPLRIMEVCGGHTHAILQYGLDQLLPGTIKLVHGPGCPVCVLPQHRIDAAINLAQRPDTILVTLGDMIRVPGSRGVSLQQTRATGADVRYLYSPLDCLAIAADNPQKTVIYVAIGFETTTPMTALLLEQAHSRQLDNLLVHSNHVLVPQAMELILAAGGAVDAFIAPGHVSVMAGAKQYHILAEKYHAPVVVSGFEPVDLLDAVLRIIHQVNTGMATVDNAYSRFVKTTGNRKAQQLVDKYFEPHDDFLWRGIGRIPGSALKLRSAYGERDAEVQCPESCPAPTEEQRGNCLCGSILMGLAQPTDCPLFAGGCTPQNPQGSCMVSNEGACAAYYKYRRDW